MSVTKQMIDFHSRKKMTKEVGAWDTSTVGMYTEFLRLCGNGICMKDISLV